MKVQRTNPSLKGLGCSCCDASFGQCSGTGMNGLGFVSGNAGLLPFNPITAGMSGLGMDSYAVMSWRPPSQTSPDGSFGMGHAPNLLLAPTDRYGRAQSHVSRSLMGLGDSVNQPGTAANTLANVTPDATPNPTAAAVVDSFSNNYGGAQPGQLPLYPNATADGLSFVQTPPPSLQCQLVQTMNANPLLWVAGAFGVFYILNHVGKKERARREKK